MVLIFIMKQDQDQMGHSSPKITEIYIRGNQDADRKKASDIMSKFLD